MTKVCGLDSIGLLSTRLGGVTTWMSGTSVASAHVAGVVARYYQLYPMYTPANIRLALQSGASPRGDVPLDSPHRFYTYDGVREGTSAERGRDHDGWRALRRRPVRALVHANGPEDTGGSGGRVPGVPLDGRGRRAEHDRWFPHDRVR
ncbi:MAG: hypothetical protein DMF89_07475 [Acidobacteria bacterium]|nr:MAG: hypothetical protein DMF89_07475 [Acidobacteriota bacterium]